jgi:benzoyl-CoA reductase/2-hydroxyglutaryl-CoA dehydratase subunit BcrC/BadD/HgdB
LGGCVVAHDHLWGDRTYASTVHERSEPWNALAHHYCFEIPSPREYPQAKADERFLQLAETARVNGVIFFHDEWDDTLGWEYPDQKKQLDERGIRSLFLKRQRYFDPDEAGQSEVIRSFIAQLQTRA